MVVPMVENLSQVEQLLGQLLLPDNQAINAASAQLKDFFKGHQCVVALVELSCKSNLPEIRQLSSVLLRRRIASRWKNQSEDTQIAVKNMLLEALLSESQRMVRQSLSRVISAIAKEDIPNGKWDELLKFLYDCCKSGEISHKESGMSILSILLETEGDFLRPHFSSLFQLFHECLHSNFSPYLVSSTIQAISEIVMELSDQDMSLFRSILPSIVSSIQFLLENSEEEAIKAFDIFDVLLDSDFGFNSNEIKSIIEFCLIVGANRNLESNTRVKGMNFISLVVSQKRRVIVKNKLTPVILQVIFPIMTESVDEEDDDLDEVTPAKFAAQILDTMAIHLPSDDIFPQAMSLFSRCFGSSSAGERCAAMTALLVLVEGCTEMMKTVLKDVLNSVYASLEDPVQKVRETACIALSELATYMQPEISDYAETILPKIFNSLSDPSPSVQERSCCALESFCENLGDDIMPYIVPLVEKLLFLLQNAKPQVIETALGALAATATASGEKFLPFFFLQWSI